MSDLLRSPLHDWHVSHGARMTTFSGWIMPLCYSSIIEEHVATRSACGLTDVSHMGRLRFEGPGARRFLDSLLTRRVSDLRPGALRYSLVTNEAGAILDDVVVGFFENFLIQPFFLLVVNAANRQKIVAWAKNILPVDEPLSLDAQTAFTDVTRLWAMFALQGPRAEEILQPLVEFDLKAVGSYRGSVVKLVHPSVQGRLAIISRTGYTGEDGFEIIMDAQIAVPVWEALLEIGRPRGLMPAGLGARDTLRLEAALPLYGHELSEEVTPLEAGLEFACDLEGRNFPGRDALARLRGEPPTRKLVCLELSGKRIPRQGYPIRLSGEVVGEVTSGTFSPTLGRPIALGYIRADLASPGLSVEIDIRGQGEPAQIIPKPFVAKKRRPERGSDC
ncbi:MAG: glycine cleavage system aminomethyltransferase GcvT [Thermoguttaceae bacterium]|nr:glycine cleavage system aminomethyltransferase GcvT [Thermoguttaceae bacterium]MDW8079391.1 glycine cleavage system aminomethyltransferase GcvT [Thermoguttaceae bacterium]